MATMVPSRTVGVAHDTFPINGTDYIEVLGSGNAKRSVRRLFIRRRGDMTLLAYSWPGNWRARPGELPAAAGEGAVRAHLGARP